MTGQTNDLRAIADSRPLKHVVVIGANGTMGYGSGGLFTQAVPKVTFLARTRAKAEEGVIAIITRNKADYAASEIPVLSPDEFLAGREPAVE